MRKKAVFVAPYFGKLPDCFPVFLQSCGKNPEFDWLILTDDTREYAYPSNVHCQNMTFRECVERFQSKLDFPLALPVPQKLCDFKCAYGYLFADLLEGYDWWGHCDLDQIFGKLRHFLTADLFEKYDKIGTLGHLTLYRNTPENNQIFLSGNRFRDVCSTAKGCGFDEWMPGNINEIFLSAGKKVYTEPLGADVSAYHTKFRLTGYHMEKGIYELDAISNSIFRWQQGELEQIYEENGQIQRREFAYLHMQKRSMRDLRTETGAEVFYILPDRFVESEESPKKLLTRAKRMGWINRQFFRVKWKSLQYRLRSGDWTFNNVFRKKKIL